MADRKHPANDAWEALLTAHSSLIRKFNAQDVWGDLSMKEYDVLYTLSKCPDPIRLGELNRHVLLSQPALSRMVGRLHGRSVAQAMLTGLTPAELRQLEELCTKLTQETTSRSE